MFAFLIALHAGSRNMKLAHRGKQAHHDRINRYIKLLRVSSSGYLGIQLTPEGLDVNIARLSAGTILPIHKHLKDGLVSSYPDTAKDEVEL